MSRRRTSLTDPPPPPNSHSPSASSSSSFNQAFAYPFSNMQPSRRAQGPIQGPDGRRLVRRVTWRSSSYKIMASLWVLGMLYIVWLIRYLFWAPGPGPNPSPSPSSNSNSNLHSGPISKHGLSG